ncbi:MAG: 4Fe-4S binding protein [Theionarchaea archaeon]|nr:4Fe-4S binding protein [Theionarchaea archaeon]
MDIIIDYSRCEEPEKCGRCLQVCSPQVFVLHPSRKNVITADRWIITPIWTGLCIGCNACVKACPQQAIRVE